MEEHKGIINRIMGTNTKTNWVNCPANNPQHRQPHSKQRIPNDIKRRAHKIPTPMPILSSQIDTYQRNKNNQMSTWPGLTTEAVQKYLPDSCPATDKGHMKRQRKCIRSTKDKINDALEQIETARCMNPPEERERMNQIFMTLGYVDKKEGKYILRLNRKVPNNINTWNDRDVHHV